MSTIHLHETFYDSWCPTVLSLFFSQGLGLLQRVSQLKGEAQKLEEEARCLEVEGWKKLGEAVAGSEAEGFYGFLRGVTTHSLPLPSQPPPKKPHPAPSTTISQPTPQDPKGPEVSDPAGQATGPSLPAAPIAPEEAIPAHMQPLRVQVGVQKGFTSAGLRAAKRACQPHEPP